MSNSTPATNPPKISTRLRWSDETKTALLVELKATEDMRKLAKEVIDAQDACNMCGLAQRFAALLKEFQRHEQNNIGGDWVSQNPITKLWIAKFEHLSRLYQGVDNPGWSHCYDLKAGKDVEFEIRPINPDYWRSIVTETKGSEE